MTAARWFVRILVLALLVVATPLVAQEQYTVQPDDTLWGIAERNLDAATAWEKIYAENAFLHEPGRRSIDEKGRIIVVINPGEHLAGVNRLGIVPTPNPPEIIKPAPVTRTPQPQVATTAAWYQSSWLWWLLGILALLLLGVWLYRRNPTEWRPVVRGGVADDTMASDLFERRASQRGASMIPGSQERVRLFGIWGTQHRGIPVPVPHRYEGERAWRARFRMSDGTERVGYMLQGCGNDVTYGGAWYVPLAGSRVEEGWGDDAPSYSSETVRVVPQTAATEPATPAPVEEPAPAAPAEPIAQPETPPVAETPAAAPVVEEEAGLIRLEIRRATDGQPAMVRMTGVDETADNTCELRPGVVTIRFTPRSAQ